MICQCNNNNALFFIRAVFGECVSNSAEMASFILGWLSLSLWVPALYPQIRLTYLKKTTDLAYAFFLLWTIGDALSLVSLVLLKQQISLIINNSYYCLIDIILNFQYFYYKHKNYNNKKTDARYKRGEILIYSLLLSTLIISFIFYSQYRLKLSENNQLMCGRIVEVSKLRQQVGTLISYLIIPIYTFSRPLQIYKNYKSRQVEAISVLSFMLTQGGNLFYGTSILIDSFFKKQLFQQCAFVISAYVPALLDIVIVIQCFYYKKQNKNLKLNNQKTENLKQREQLIIFQ